MRRLILTAVVAVTAAVVAVAAAVATRDVRPGGTKPQLGTESSRKAPTVTVGLTVDSHRAVADNGAPEFAVSVAVVPRVVASIAVPSSGLGCPGTCPSRVHVAVSALLDLDRPVTARGAAVSTMTVGRGEAAVPLAIGPLSPGLHCLLVAAVAPAHDIVGRHVPDYGGTAIFFLRAGHSGGDHCRAARTRLPTTPMTLPRDLNPCRTALLSTRTAGLSFGNRAGLGAVRYATLAPCDATRVSYAFTRNGAFVGGGGGTYRPGAVDRSGGSRFATVRFDDAASWRVVVLWSDGSRALDVETSLPLVVT